MLPDPSSTPFSTKSYPFERTSHGAVSSFSKSSSTIPVNGCCALTQVLSDSLHSNSGKPVSHKNFHCVLSITPSASPNCKRNCPATSAAASVPLISSCAETATTKSPVFAPHASASFFTFSTPINFSTVDVVPSAASFTKYAPRAPCDFAFSVSSSSCLREYVAAPGAAKANTFPPICSFSFASTGKHDVASCNSIPNRMSGLSLP